jgi:hypothetical protein
VLACLPAEDDESLTADEKALLRFQKQRLREMSGGKFSLPDDDGGGGGGGGGPEDQLTHMGRSLAELEDLQEVRFFAMYCIVVPCTAVHCSALHRSVLALHFWGGQPVFKG